MIDKINTQLKIIKPDEIFIIDGIELSNAIIVELKVENSKIFDDPTFQESLVVYPEVLKSVDKDGKYLIFTSASGIADAAGWDGVLVKRDEEFIYWAFEFDGKMYKYKFYKSEYIDSILKLKKEIDELKKIYDLEPTEVSFPESWEKLWMYYPDD